MMKWGSPSTESTSEKGLAPGALTHSSRGPSPPLLAPVGRLLTGSGLWALGLREESGELTVVVGRLRRLVAGCGHQGREAELNEWARKAPGPTSRPWFMRPPFPLPRAPTPPPSSSGAQPSACSGERIQGGLEENVTWGHSRGRAPWVGGLWLLPYTYSGKPWSGPLKKAAKGQS